MAILYVNQGCENPHSGSSWEATKKTLEIAPKTLGCGGDSSKFSIETQPNVKGLKEVEVVYKQPKYTCKVQRKLLRRKMKHK